MGQRNRNASAPRVASLLASGTEILYALGAGDNVVAISHECDYPPECVDKPRVTRARVDASAPSGEIDAQVRALLAAGEPLYEIDVKRLAALKPDVIVTQAHCEVCAVSDRDVHAALERSPALRNARVISLNPTTLSAVLNDILRVGEAIGRLEAAEHFHMLLVVRLASAAAKSLGRGRRKKTTVACIEWMDPLMVAANWMPDLIRRAGGRPVITKAGARSRETSWKTLRKADPDVIVIAPCGFDAERTKAELPILLQNPEFTALRAVRESHVYIADGNALFNRSGPRLVDTIELLAQFLLDARDASSTAK